ncbi:hypothetical protein BG004_001865 [Podila humilis]|nr:hypothetical protein BG004_001865 [Podila humilis]
MPISENLIVQSKGGQGALPVGTPIRSFVLTDPSSPGMVCQVTTLGASLTHLWVPDRSFDRNSKKKDEHGILDGVRDIVQGFDDLTLYRQIDPYFGASVGRVANRIARGEFVINDQTYKLEINNPPNALHGGKDGFSHRIWNVSFDGQVASDAAKSSLLFWLDSADQDQGYPGKVQVSCTYTLQDYCLEIVYEAKLAEDSPRDLVTIVNLTNHSYFNLEGFPVRPPARFNSIMDHEIQMKNVQGFLELDDNTLIPTGRIIPAPQWPCMNFETPKTIRDNIKDVPNNNNTGGYDHFFVSRDGGTALAQRTDGNTIMDRSNTVPTELAKVYSPGSGIEMTMSTTEPGFQLYTDNHQNIPSKLYDAETAKSSPGGSGGCSGRYIGKAFTGYQLYSGICLETSRFPDAIHKDSWKDQVLLTKGQTYFAKTRFAFSTRE